MKRKMLYAVGCLILIAGVLLSCDDVLTERALAGDYFPLDEDSRWEYATVHTYGCRCFDSGLVLRDTVRLRAEETLFVDGIFFQLVDHRGWTYKVVRKLKNQYLESPAYSPEFIFLDPTVPVGFSWITDKARKNKLELTAVNLTKVVNNITYDHVIEVKETTCSQKDQGIPDIFSITYYYYAREVGLIFSRRTYGDLGEQSTIETTLLRYWRE